MRYFTLLLLLAAVTSFFPKNGSAQNDVPIHPNLIGEGKFLGISPPLRDLPPITDAEFAAMKEKALKKAASKVIKPRLYPYAETALPKGVDAAWQKEMGQSAGSRAPLVNFEGQTTTSFPPDCNGTAGPNHFMQTVNTTYAIYNKTGTKLAGPTNMNLLFGNVAGATCNDGDPLIQYDEQAGRWLAVEFSLCGSNDLMLIAVSTSNDPTGTWYQYSFDVTDMPDYEKIGVWQDGYYMGTNTSSGNDIYVFERSKMLVGQPAQMVAFDNPNRPGTGFLCVPPLDNDGVSAPAGTPGMFIAFNDDAVAGGSDQLWLYNLTVNWVTPSASTFARTQMLGVTPFDSQFTAAWDDITQPNTQKLDGVPQVIMNAPQYRNFGTYQTIVCCHTVDVDATNHAGIRWYELRKTPPATTWTIRQQGTFAPDAHSRWMGSIMLNGGGKIALGYSISSSTVYPGIRYCGQSASGYASATGILDIPEEIIHSGTVAQTTYNRWGDYSLLSVDPVDDQTFWYTTEYVKTGGTTKGTKIASFKFGNDPAVTTLAPTSVTGTSATFNGTVNPNGLATTWYFQWGTTVNYGNSTTVASVGSGTTAIAVSSNLTGLTAGTTYHYRLVGVNADGTTYGGDIAFIPGAASVTTTTVTAITMNSAMSGGTVTTDGGSAITARGVCWATTANPTVAGSHTTDGTGTGTFTSAITGLTSNTLYHVRAYATNAAGTAYGSDLTFNTICGIVSVFPWNEGFENGGAIPNCWTQEQVNSSGLNWTFITGSGNSHPAAAHGGTYNACLKDNSSADNKTRLVTPPLNLAFVTAPQLKFWHTQAFWSPDQDLLSVYYKTSAGGTWTLLATYTANLTAWTQETIGLPSTSAEYYIAFEGNAKYGYGVCLDDVQVISPCTMLTPVTVSISASANPVCAGTSVTFTAIPTNGGPNPAYQWKVNGVNVTGATNVTYTFVPANNNAVTCVLTSNASCTTDNPATSSPVTMTVNPFLTAGSISANQTICANSIPLALTGTVPLNGTLPSYQWQSSLNNTTFTNINGATMLNFQPGSLSVTNYYRQLQNATGTCGGPLPTNTVTVATNPLLPVSVTIVPSANTVCAGTPVTYTPLPVNGGTPAYQWFRNSTASGSGATFTCVPSDGDEVYAFMTSSLVCKTGSPAQSNTLVANVDPVMPVSVSIVSSGNNVCEGTPVTFTALQVNGGNPVYQWFKNTIAVGSGINYTCMPEDGDQLYVIMTSDLTCKQGSPATSNTITMIVNPNPEVLVIIEPSANNVCAGTTVTLTPTPVNGGTPSYQWYKNTVSAGTGATFTFIPADNDEVYALMTSSLACKTGSPAQSNTVIMNVDPVMPVSVSIASSGNNVCAGTPVTFTAMQVNGGNPVYQWFKNTVAVGSGITYTCIPENGDQVYVIMSSDLICKEGSPATSDTITMVVNPNPEVSVSIEPSANNVCAGTSITFTPAPVNGGTPTYEWFKNAVSAGSGITYTCIPENGDQVYVIMTSDLICKEGSPATSDTITMVVNPNPEVSVSIEPSANNVCAGATVTFTPAPVNGGTPSYEWFRNSVLAGTGATYSFIPADGDQVYVVMTSGLACKTGSPATSSTVTMTVNPNLPVSVAIVASDNPVDKKIPVTFTATAVNGGTSPVYQWMVNEINAGTNSMSYSYLPVNGDTVTCILTSAEVCTQANPVYSNPIVMEVNPVSMNDNLQDITVTGTECFDALHTIYVAGNSTTFTVPTGAHATLIAGQNILFYPGTVVAQGGYMNGYIAQNGPWCITQPFIAVMNGTDESRQEPGRQFYKIYPNPTTGSFTLEMDPAIKSGNCQVEIFDMKGVRILTKELSEEWKHEFSLSGEPVGIYLIRVIGKSNYGTTRIIRQ